MSERCSFFVPGPTWVRPEIRAELARPMIGHRSSEFRALFAKVREDLKSLLRTSHNTFVITASGTGLLEGALLNCARRRVLVTTSGAFSERWASIAETLGLEVERLDHPWGQPVDPERLATQITGRRGHYDAITITHNETSTGVLNDLQALTEVIHAESDDTLILVDAVSSLGCTPVLMDEWGIDVVVASSQKGIAIPPGLTVLGVSERAIEAAAKKPYRGSYFDFVNFKKQADGDGAPFTPAIPLFFALVKQLDHILREETLEKRWERHIRMREITINRTEGYADLIPPRGHASPSVSALRPKSMTGPEVTAKMRERGFTLGGGYGAWKEDSFRIGHMGDISVEDLEAMLDVLEEVMRA